MAQKAGISKHIKQLLLDGLRLQSQVILLANQGKLYHSPMAVTVLQLQTTVSAQV